MKPFFFNGDFKFDEIEHEGSKIDFLIPDLNSKIWTINLANLFGPMLRDEIRLETHGIISKLMILLTFVFDFICFVFQINRALFFNHQGFSTNLHSDEQIEHFKTSIPIIAAKHPKSAIIIRSIRPIQLKHFDNNFYKIPTRLVFINYDAKSDFKNRSNCQKDANLFKRYNLKLVEHDDLPQDWKIEKALFQYRELYLGKYSKNSPDFTSYYLKKLLSDKVLKFYSIEDDNSNSLAFFTLYENAGQATPPLIGYDKLSKIPLYRALMIGALQVAAQNNLILNNSAGAPIFKARRGGIGEIEYMLVYANHLNFWRKFGYWTIEKISAFMLPWFEKIAKRGFGE